MTQEKAGDAAAASPAEPSEIPAEPSEAPAEPAAESAPVEGQAPAAPATPQDSAATGSGRHRVPGQGSLGIWAFVLAILGLIGLLPLIGSVLGFVLGRVALRQADSRPIRGGRGLAVAAVTISAITLAVIAISVAAYALVVAYLEI